MQLKKQVMPDENSWLVQYFLKFVENLRVEGGDDLWSLLQDYFSNFTTHCQYSNATNDLVLYPFLVLDKSHNTIKLLKLEYVSKVVSDLISTNYLENHSHKKIEEQKPEVIKTNTKISSFFSKKKEIVHEHEETKLDHKHDFNEAKINLTKFNDNLTVSQAGDILLKASYKRINNKQAFVEELERNQSNELEKQVFLDVSYLFENFFKADQNHAFTKFFDANKKALMKFRVSSTDSIEIPEHLKDKELIRL